jgi:hypothetical protein
MSESETYQSGLPDWTWRVIVYTEQRGELILGALEPTRAAAKQYVDDKLEIEVQDWRETYIPSATWDCPVCGVHEGATKQPNLRGDHDWECIDCGSQMWGEPMDWHRIEEGQRVPDYRSGSVQKRLDGGERHV